MLFGHQSLLGLSSFLMQGLHRICLQLLWVQVIKIKVPKHTFQHVNKLLGVGTGTGDVDTAKSFALIFSSSLLEFATDLDQSNPLKMQRVTF